MTDQQHTPEPWNLMQSGFSTSGIWSAPTVYATDAELRYIAVCACADYMNIHSATDNLANARRIVACVNALEGLSQDALDDGWNFRGINEYARGLEIQRDRLLEAFKEALKEFEFYGHELQAHRYAEILEGIEASK